MIPKKIHYCWIGGNRKPDLVEKCIKSWKKYCPDYEILEWNELNYDFSKNTYMRQAYEAKKWGFVPDYARLDIVYEQGGIYLDTDVQLIRRIDDLLTHEAFAGIEITSGEEYFVNFGSGFGAEKNSKVIKRLRDFYDNIEFIDKNGNCNMTPSPKYSTDCLRELGYQNKNVFQSLNGISIYPSEFLCPQSWETGLRKITPNTYSIHHYTASWYDEEKQKNYRKKLRQYKIDYWVHVPNRWARRILGDCAYEKIKKICRPER